jgi:putative spermidine/putrescine transport system permease protein
MAAAAQAREHPRAPGWSAAAMLAPAAIVVVIGIVIPIVILFRYSLNHFTPAKMMVDAFTAENYVKFFTDPFYVAVLLRTIRVATVCTAICVILAFPMAYVLARTRSRYKNLLLLIVILPLFVGNAVRAAGWMVMFGTRGFVNAVAMGLGLIHEPLQIMYTEFAVVVGIVAVNLPFVVLTLQAVLEGIERPIEEAALGLGAGPLRTFRHVILPLAMPGVIAGTILSFILAMNAYATPVLLGGPTFHMMGPTVYDQFAGLTNWPFGAALAFVLMIATLLLTVTSNWLAQRRYRR